MIDVIDIIRITDGQMTEHWWCLSSIARPPM
jgi:predicted SnoaL-like aldol condensation-catalyzing enzyme